VSFSVDCYLTYCDVVTHLSQRTCLPSYTHSQKRRISEIGYGCIYPEAPHLLPMTSMVEVDGQLIEVTNGDRENAKAWFMYSEKDPSDASMALQETPMHYFGLDASISIIKECLCKLEKEESCTIFGFSQGATFVHILSMLAATARKKPDCKYLSPFAKIDSAILVSGFASMHQGSVTETIQDTNSEDLIEIRSLHIIGDRDTSVPKSYGDKFAALYSEPQIYIHDKGHFIPHNKALIDTVIEFLETHDE
jgi:predicted esterase